MIYIIEHTNYGDVFRYYEGMGQDAVEALVSLNGNSFSVVNEEEFRRLEAEAVASRQASLNQGEAEGDV